MPDHELTAYERVAIQLEAIVPLIRDLQEVLGTEVVLEALQERVRRQIDKAHAAPAREPDFALVDAAMARFAAGGALDYETLGRSDDHVDMDVTRCAYAELMDRLGARDLGPALLCGTDHAAAIAVGTRLDRTRTCMEGASSCDFRFRRPQPGEGSG